MKEQENVSGTHSEQVSDISEKTNDNLSAVNDYKRDMFKFKERAKELEQKLSEYELKEQESKGNLQDVIQKLKDENRNLRGENAQSKLMFAQGKIEDAIKRKAVEQGCKNADVFFKLIDGTDLKTIELDSKFNPKTDDIDVLVDRYKKQYDNLGFFSKSVNVVDKAPNSKPNESKKPSKSLDELTQDELMKLAEQQGMKRINY